MFVIRSSSSWSKNCVVFFAPGHEQFDVGNRARQEVKPKLWFENVCLGHQQDTLFFSASGIHTAEWGYEAALLSQ